MSTRERRLRDDTGDSIYCDIDEINEISGAGTPPVYLPYTSGAGVFDTLSGLKNVATKVVKKLTGKAAKKIATKAVEKALEKGAEKVGEKTGQKIGDLGEKIYDTFSHSKTPNPTGDQIIKELSKIEIPGESRKVKTHVKPQAKPVSQQFTVPINNTGEKSISQQFDELLLRFQ